jgi:hypothetical protein
MILGATQEQKAFGYKGNKPLPEQIHERKHVDELGSK